MRPAVIILFPDIRDNGVTYLRPLKKYIVPSPKKLIPPASLQIGPTSKNYAEFFANALYFEERQMQMDIRQYDMENATFQKKRDLHFLEVAGLEESRPSVIRGDHVFVHFPSVPSLEV